METLHGIPALPFSRADAYSDIDKGSLWCCAKALGSLLSHAQRRGRAAAYVALLLGVHLGIEDDTSRNMVNFFVAVAIGGPHMMSTFLAHWLGPSASRNVTPTLIRSSIIIPVIVISLAFLKPEPDADVFLFLGSLHVLHQVPISLSYTTQRAKFVRRKRAQLVFRRLIDYAIVLTSLFPIAMWKNQPGQLRNWTE